MESRQIDAERVIAKLLSRKRQLRVSSTVVQFRILLTFILGILFSIFSSWSTSIEIISNVAALTVLIAAAVMMSIQRRHALRKLLKSPGKQQLQPGQAPFFFERMEIHRQQLGIKRLNVLLNPFAFSANASAFEHDGQNYLFLSVGLIKLSSTRPDETSAIITHELAHIAHEDSHLWILAHIFSSALRVLLIPFSVLNAVLTLAILATIEGANPLSFLLALLYPLVPIAFLYTVALKRRQSEEAADWVAVIQVGGTALKSALGMFEDNGGGSPFSVHPTNSWRCDRIYHLLSKYPTLASPPHGEYPLTYTAAP